MEILLFEFWPWILLGGGLMVWGIKTVDLPRKQWVYLLISLFYLPLLDDTKTEKKQLSRPADEIMSANPGCVMVASGVALILFGVVRWFT